MGSDNKYDDVLNGSQSWIPTLEEPLPFDPGTSTPQDYQRAFTSINADIMRLTELSEEMDKSVVKSLSDFILKSISPPPSSFQFARISNMPDIYNKGVIQWPGIPPASIAKIARENIAPLMIINMRQDDVLRYSNHARNDEPWKPGWSILPVHSSIEKDESIKKDIEQAISFLLNCNSEITDFRERNRKELTDFKTFLAALTRDTLTFDGMAVWTDTDNSGKIKAFKALSAQNIRLCNPREGYEGDKDIFAVGIDETGNVKELFTREELIWHIRNPMADPSFSGYGYPEISMGVRLIQGFQNAIDLNISRFEKSCLSEDTEILTKEGWKKFDELNDTDVVLTMDMHTKESSYQKPTQIIWQDYEGDMYHIKSNMIDYLVTPNHRVLFDYRPAILTTGKTDPSTEIASDLYDKIKGVSKSSRNNYVVPSTSKWKGVEIQPKEFVFGRILIGGIQEYEKTKKIGAVPNTITMSGDDYCAFMGMYLSEGSTAHQFRDGKSDTKEIVSIHQKRDSKGWIPYKEVLDRIFQKEVPFYDNVSPRFTVGCKNLAQYLVKFGKCADKYIPDEILNATPKQQKIFWDFYCLGDGTYDIRKIPSRSTRAKGVYQRIVTTSKKMADGLQELAQKMGYSARISTRTVEYWEKYKSTTTSTGREIKAKRTQYHISLRTSHYNSFDMEKIYYKGKIGCVSVPNTIIYVRRNGIPGWTGNSIPNGMFIFKGQGWVRSQLDRLARLFVNMKRGVTKSWTIPLIMAPKDAEIELLDFTNIKGTEVYYQDFMNMMVGAFCTIYRFPVDRLGYRASGKGPDREVPLKDTGLVTADMDDPGREPLLGHIEHVVNMILQTRWPHLKFVFHGKNPKEDAREYEARILAMTVDERRSAVGLPPLHKSPSVSALDEDQKKNLILAGTAPVDPALAGVFQSIFLAKQAEQARFESKRDPVQSEKHGHTSGIRRDSASEASNADNKND